MNGTNPTQNIRLMDLNEMRILFAVLMGILCIVTILGNIIVIYKYRKTSMVGNLFIISLACADLIVGLLVMPVAALYSINEVWTYSLPVCLIWLSADYTASTASILNLLILSLDRYWSITSPLEYLSKRTKSRALIMIGFAWSISLLWLVPITGWPYFFNQGKRTVAKNKCNTEYNKSILFKVATAIINFYIPLIAMIAINTKIYLVIHKRYRNPIMRYSSIVSNENTKPAVNRPRSLSICSCIEEEPTNTCPNMSKNKKYKLIYTNGNVAKLVRSKSEENIQKIESLGQKESNSDSDTNRYRLSRIKNCSIFTSQQAQSSNPNEKNLMKQVCKKKCHQVLNNGKSKMAKQIDTKLTVNRKGFMNKQEKAFKQLSSIVIGFTFCFTPYFIVFLIVAICENCVSNDVFTVTVWLGYFNSTINPFLYALSNKRIKKQGNHYRINTTTTNEFSRRKSLKMVGRKSFDQSTHLSTRLNMLR